MIDNYLKYIYDCYQDAPKGFCVGLLIVLCLVALLLLLFMGIKSGFKWAVRFLLFEYLMLLFSLTVLFRPVQTARVFDFIPFWSYRTVREGGHELLLIQIIMNVVAFIPVGLLLGTALGRMKWWTVFLIGFVFSLLIETLQFVLKRGFVEFDDVFHNVSGCMIGYGVYMGVSFLVKRLSRPQQQMSDDVSII